MLYILDDMITITLLRLECLSLDQQVPLGFPADGRLWIPTRVNPQSFLTPLRSEYRKGMHGDVREKASSFVFKKTDLNFLS